MKALSIRMSPFSRDIILEDNENDPSVAVNGSRQPRPGRRTRTAVNPGRDREFNGDMVDTISKLGQADDTEALLRRLRQLNA